MIMLSREYADSTHTYSHSREERRRGKARKEAIYLYVNGPAYAGDGASRVGWIIAAAAADSVAGNEERESQEIFPPTTLLFSAGTATRLVWIKY